jgi:hypothetical protein
MTTAPACLVSAVSAWSQNAPNCTCNSAGETRMTTETRVLIALKGVKILFLIGQKIRKKNTPLREFVGLSGPLVSPLLRLINSAFAETNRDQKNLAGTKTAPPGKDV